VATRILSKGVTERGNAILAGIDEYRFAVANLQVNGSAAILRHRANDADFRERMQHSIDVAGMAYLQAGRTPARRS
jgi:hypothetical protein